MDKNKKSNIICTVIGLIIIVPTVLILVFATIRNSAPQNRGPHNVEETTNLVSITDNIILDETSDMDHTIPSINGGTEISSAVPLEKPDIDVSEMTRNPSPEVVEIEADYWQKETTEDE